MSVATTLLFCFCLFLSAGFVLFTVLLFLSCFFFAFFMLSSSKLSFSTYTTVCQWDGTGVVVFVIVGSCMFCVFSFFLELSICVAFAVFLSIVSVFHCFLYSGLVIMIIIILLIL
eukprot:GCRY01005266.1.p1 GENE.GCRY01005266.1~~GCRY01005266.1.p1  ORF type:complete len:115 (+),score=11.22 GCRY01005266.1:458-802(+)